MTNRLATDQSQTVVWRWEGEAFGNTPAQELAGFSVNLRFPGQYYDQETGLLYNLNRYYSTDIGRYITSDPVGITGGLNTYNYANVNPVVGIDPFGLFSNIFEHGRGNFSDTKGGSSGDCRVPIWSGGFIIGWKPCTAEEECDNGSGSNDETKDTQESKTESGPGTGSEPGAESTGPECDSECLKRKYPRPREDFRLDCTISCLTYPLQGTLSCYGLSAIGGAVSRDVRGATAVNVACQVARISACTTICMDMKSHHQKFPPTE